jgi:hypothetical protein
MRCCDEIVLDLGWSQSHVLGVRVVVGEWMTQALQWPASGGGCHVPTVLSLFSRTESVTKFSIGIHPLDSCSHGKVGDRRRGGRRFDFCEVLTTFLVFLCLFLVCFFVFLFHQSNHRSMQQSSSAQQQCERKMYSSAV